ncbi:phage tail spike protein, partial [Bacillus thuringiensis]
MKKVSGLFHIVDFKTEKIIAVLQPKDYYDDLRHWELKSNIDTLTFKVLIDNPNADALIQQNLILRQTRDGRFIPYVIEEAIQTKDGRFIEVFSSAVWVEIAQSGIIRPQRIEGKTVNEFIDMALIGMKWKLGKTDYAGFHTMTIDEFIDPLTFLGKIASLFNLEIQYRVEVFANKIVNWYVDMIVKRGRYTGKEINLGKDLINVRRIENTRNICTALVGFVRGEGDSIITIESINNGLPYIVDNEAFQRWNVKGFHRFGFYTPETDNQNMTQQRLLTLMEMEIKKRKAASVSYEVDAQNLERVKGFEHEQVGEGDTIIIKDPGFKPKLYLEARVIAGDESFKDPTAEKYLFGNYREITDPNEEMRKLYNRLLGQLTGKANKELLDQLEKLVEENGKTIETIREESKAVKELAEKVQENLKNNTVNIIESKQPPTENLQIGKTIWRDISNGKPGILKVWNGKGWELLIPDVESIKKDTLEQVTKEINASAEKLDARVKEAETKADNLQKDFAAVKGEQERVSQVTKTLEESDKGTKETIKSLQGTQESMGRTIVETSKGVEGLKNTVSDIQKDQSGITDRVVKTEQNINGISSSIEQINKTSSQTIQRLNQVEQDANGTKQIIERIEKDVNSLDGDVINLVRGTKTLTANEELSLKGARLAVIKDTYNGNAIAQTDTEWQGIAVKPSELIKRGKIKVGDTVTFSVVARMIGGESTQVFFPNSAGKTTVNGEWKRVSVTIPVGSDATDPNVVYRFEAESMPKGALYQQTSPMLSLTKKVYPWRPAPEDQADSNDFIKVTTEITQQAGKISEKLTEVTGKVNNLKPGGRNFLLNTDFKRYITNEKRGWDNTLNGTLQLSDWQGEFNGGVQQPEKGYHAHVDVKKFGYPVLAMISKNSIIGLPGRWLGLNQIIIDDFKNGDIAGKEVTISMDIWTESGSNNISGGPYHFIEGNTNQTFHSGQFSIGVDKVKQWVRYSQTLKLHDKYDVSKVTHLYIYGHTGNEGERYIKNVQIEIGNIATEWQPALEENVSTDEFTKKTTEIEKSVNGIKESIKTVEKTQVDFSQRVTTVEKTADGIKENVTSLKEIQTKQGTQLQEAKSGWETTANALEGKVEIKDVEDYVGGIGNQTVLRNVLWKNDTKYWVLQSGTTRDTQVTYKGCNSLSVITTGNASNLYKGASHEYINAGPGWNYVFSAYFYTDNKASIDAGAAIELQCYDVNNKMIKSYLQEITISQGTWIRTHVAGLLIEGTKKVKVMFWVRKNGRLWMAQPMLQIGDKPSSFMENPVDIVDKDKIMEELADKIATKDYDKKVTELERSISATEEGVEITSKKQEKFINETYAAYVKETGSKLKVLDEGILAEVKKGNIIAAINFSSEKLEIDVSKVAINADTMVKWLTAKGIDTNVINVNGDKITIDKDGVTVKMLDFLFQDEWGTKTTAVSRRNLIADPDFSSVTKKNIGHNDYYGFEGGYGLTWKSWGNVVIEKNTHIFDYEQMVNAARVDMYNYPEAIVNNGIHPGNEYTASAHFRTAMINGVRKTGKPRIHVCCVKFRDNVSYDIWSEQKMDFPEPSTFYGEIRRYSFTFKVPTNYIPQQHALIIKVCSGNADMRQGTAICVSGVTLYSGKYASMYNWDRAAAERADGIQPFNALAVGGVNNNITPAPDGQTFDLSTEKEVKIFRNIRAMQGINLGGGGFQQWGHIRFT